MKGNVFRDLSQQERHILEKIGLCSTSKEPLQHFCSDCSILLCNKCFHDTHKKHEGREIKFTDGSAEFDALSSCAKQIHEQRVQGLEEKLLQLDTNAKILESMKTIVSTFNKLSKELTDIAKRIETGTISRIDKSIKHNKEHTALVYKDIGRRLKDEEESFSNLHSDLENIRHLKPIVRACYCQAFIEKKKKQKDHDDIYVIEEVPLDKKEFSNYYFDIIGRLVEHGVDCMVESMKVIDTEECTEELEGAFKHIEGVIMGKIRKYRGVERSQRNFEISRRNSHDSSGTKPENT